jgi:hypothetical protein
MLRQRATGPVEGDTIMKRTLKMSVLGAALAATTLAPLAEASAGDRWRHRYHDHDNAGAIIAAGALGLLTGALIADSRRTYAEPVYVDRYHYAPAPVYQRRVYVEPEVRYVRSRDYYGSLEPWTAEWYRYCEDRYRSFDPDSGTFLGYDGMRHFCQP